MRRTKIVCTLGPSSRGPHQIDRLIDCGMNVARLNLSHGTHDEHAVAFGRVREEARRKGRPVGVLFDLAGPKVRVGRFPSGRVELVVGEVVALVPGDDDTVGDARTIPVSYPTLGAEVRLGDPVLLADGMLRLEVVEARPGETRCLVVDGGALGDHQGVHLPGGVRASGVSDKDLEDIAWGRDLGADFFAISFVRSAEDVVRARAVAGDVPLIAKIERAHAVSALEQIADEADGLMVARGDLGVELGPEKVPLVQKHAIEVANERGKVVIVATEMLESMKTSPRPTRAEASDVANAVLDGADALMLSGETATGRYAAEAVATMVRIIEEVESSARYRARRDPPQLDLAISTNAIAHAAVVAQHAMRLGVIAVFSDSGATARLLSDYRPDARIAALTTRPEICRRLALYWGVEPLISDRREDTDGMIAEAEARLLAAGMVKPGDEIVLTMGVPVGASSNLLKIHRVGG
ncbi:MAG: pyruvate kinase [Myxococcota bacterium]